MAAPHYTPSGAPIQGADGTSKDLRDEFALIEAGIEVLNRYALNAYFADLNTAQSLFVPVPFSCQIVLCTGAIHDANGTTDTIVTFEIGGVLVVMDSNGEMTFTSTAGAGSVAGATPASNNQVTVGTPIEVITDGGGSTTMKAHIQMVLRRV